MEQVCYEERRAPSRARRARLARREGARARGGLGRALRAARDDPRLRRRAAPRRAARCTPSGTPTPTTSSRSRRGVAAGIKGTGQLEARAARPRRQREHARGDPVAHRVRPRRRPGGAREGAPARRPPRLVLAHRRPAPHRARHGWTRSSRWRPVRRRAAAAALALLAERHDLLGDRRVGARPRGVDRGIPGGTRRRRRAGRRRGDPARRLLPPARRAHGRGPHGHRRGARAKRSRT